MGRDGVAGGGGVSGTDKLSKRVLNYTGVGMAEGYEAGGIVGRPQISIPFGMNIILVLEILVSMVLELKTFVQTWLKFDVVIM